jgi:hypothetical protein
MENAKNSGQVAGMNQSLDKFAAVVEALAEVRHEISISGYLPCPQATSSFCSRVVFENAM